ncbi:MAG: hypothetical protein IH576_00655 [Deltaproteobacteria bacterium]|nr:hypothetical protein [Deltaproteobacteria bacterium]
MKRAKGFIASILFVSSLVAAPLLFAGQEIILVGGTRAVIEGQQLILIGKNSERTVAPPGYYNIRASSQAIFVGKDGVQVGESPRGLR